jgi:cellulose biosynthesis protein BcsQ
MNKEGKVISVFSSKGGCGKSFYSTYIPLGISKNDPEAKILVIDLCKNSSVAKEYGLSKDINFSAYDWYSSKGKNFGDCVERFGKSNIYYMPSNSEVDKIVDWTNENLRVNREYFLKKLIEPLKNHFDYIFIDNHPSENDDKSLYSIIAADYVLLAATAELSSMESTLNDIELVNEVREAIPNDLKLLVAINKVEYIKGDSSYISNFTKKLEAKGVTHLQILPEIRYAAPIKRNKLYHILKDENLAGNKYVKNVLNDVYIHSKEVIKHVR